MTGTHGPVSLNEIRFVFGRAGFGAGLPWGLADEFAEACVCLALAGMDPGPVAAGALQALDAGASGRTAALAEKEKEAGRAVLRAGEGGALSALHAGPAAGDWLAVHGDAALDVAATDVPLLVVAYLAGPSQASGARSVSWRALAGGAEGAVAVDAEGAIRAAPDQVARLVSAGPAAMAIRPAQGTAAVPAHAADPPVLETGVRIEAGAWAAVSVYFARSLVPSTEADRLAGAGAGLVDTD